jgi:hypothetical protein
VFATLIEDASLHGYYNSLFIQVNEFWFFHPPHIAYHESLMAAEKDEVINLKITPEIGPAVAKAEES